MKAFANRAIAAAQTIPIRGDVDANLDQHRQLIGLAADAHAQVVVFPELSLTGYEPDLAHGLAFSETDARLAPLAELVSACGMTVIVGAPVKVESQLHIGAFIVGPGRALDLYTKQHLGAFAPGASLDGVVPPGEATVFHPGSLNPLVRFRGHTAAVAVCADTKRPSHPQSAAQRGADVYLASMFVIPADIEQETQALRSYAVRHSMAVVLANYGGPSGGLTSGGRSAIWSEKGDLLVQLAERGAGLAVAVESESVWRADAIMLR